MINWAFSTKQRMKLAGFLGVLLVIILVKNTIEQRSFSNMNDAVSSFYEDRLLPATYVFHLTDHLYQRRLLLEEHAATSAGDMGEALYLGQLKVHHDAMDSLVADFERTWLVEEEDLVLDDFKGHIAEYRNKEKEWLASGIDILQPGAPREGFMQIFEQTLGELATLSRIQTDEGKLLRDNSRAEKASSDLLSNLELVLIILIGVVIQALVFSAKAGNAKIKPTDAQLN